MKAISFLLLNLVVLCCFSQSKEQLALLDSAQNAWMKNDHRAAVLFYARAFAMGGNAQRVTDRVNDAAQWALLGNADSAFAHLNFAVSIGYDEYLPTLTASEFDLLHTDQRWDKTVRGIYANREIAMARSGLDKTLVAIFDTIVYDDQGLRSRISYVENNYGVNSTAMKDLWKRINEKDSINVLKVTALLDKYGWLPASKIGNDGNTAQFLVIQHAPLNVQQKYLPLMREAVKNGNAQSYDLALLEDRVNLRTGKKQLYGSQMVVDTATGKFYVRPLEDPEHVDELRAKVGLQPLADYVRSFNITWSLEQYKKDLKLIEELSRKNP